MEQENDNLRMRLWQGLVQNGLYLGKMWVKVSTNNNGQNSKIRLLLLAKC